MPLYVKGDRVIINSPQLQTISQNLAVYENSLLTLIALGARGGALEVPLNKICCVS